jgi:hypothetical protein
MVKAVRSRGLYKGSKNMDSTWKTRRNVLVIGVVRNIKINSISLESDDCPGRNRRMTLMNLHLPLQQRQIKVSDRYELQ